MLLCFHWNVLKYFVVFSLECFWNLYLNSVSLYVDMIFRTQMAWEFNYMYGKRWTIMYYKNVKKLLKYCVVKLLFNGPVYTTEYRS